MRIERRRCSRCTDLFPETYEVFEEKKRLELGLLDSAPSLRLWCKSRGCFMDGSECFVLAFTFAFRSRSGDDLGLNISVLLLDDSHYTVDVVRYLQKIVFSCGVWQLYLKLGHGTTN